MILPSPRLLVAAANAFIGVNGVQTDAEGEADSQRTQLLDLMERDAGCAGAGGEWSATFVHHVGFWSHFDHAGCVSTWPLPALTNCDHLASYAKARGVLVADPHPAHGDVFVQWSPSAKRYVRAGIVVGCIGPRPRFEVEEPFVECIVIEGNSDAAGQLGGDAVVSITRKLFMAGRDRLIRWTALALTLRSADPARPANRIISALIDAPNVRRAA